MIDQIRKLAVEALKVDFPSAVDGTQFTVGYVRGFIAGRTSVTREQLAEVMFNAYADETGKPWAEEGHGIRSLYLEQADAVLALLNGGENENE